jgi:hypothetical protein
MAAPTHIRLTIYLGTMIPYAGAVVALPLALAFAHVLIGEILPLGVADLGLAGHLLAVNAAVDLPVVAARADVEQPEAGSAALLAERLHLGARDVEKLAPRREGVEPARRSGAVLHRVCRAEAPSWYSGPHVSHVAGRWRSTPTPLLDPVSAPAPGCACSGCPR